MNRLRPALLAVTVVSAALMAFGFLTLPSSEDLNHEGFSAVRVLQDVEVISRDHHSVAHPQERAAVRDYLVSRLEELGGDVKLYTYDSLSGPDNKFVRYTFDACNIVAEFQPEDTSSAGSSLMLVAHYDSRYAQPVLKDTVWSYGAADDGYGVGVILETVSQTLKKRAEWKQGIKVLFTDAEEVGMKGMRAIWENNREVFGDVGLVVNVEARGTWGPALLFETSPGNEKLMELYASSAKYPCTYSLTTVVYRMMPNFTDFTIVKDSLPGMNFSNIADVNSYHTDLDCYDNVSARTVQHYGAQILPVCMNYLCSEEYSDREALKSERDRTFFTIPIFGLFSFTSVAYKVINAVIFLIFLLLFALEGVRGRLKAMPVFRNSCLVLVSGILVLVLGELMAYIFAAAVGSEFSLFGIVRGIKCDNIAMAVFVIVMSAIAVSVYVVLRKRAVRAASVSMRANAASAAASQHAFKVLYATLILLFVLAVAALLALGENMMFMIPLCAATLSMILWHITSWRIWLLAGIFVILLHACSFLFALAMALTIGAFGAVALLAFFDLMVIIPVADLYLINRRR